MPRPWKFVLGCLAATACLFCAGLARSAAPRKVMSLSYTPSQVQAYAEIEAGIPTARIRADLQRLAPYTHAIRTYALEKNLDQIPVVAKELGLKVSLGLWLGKDPAKNAAEVKRGIASIKANPGTITRVYVGNEAVLRGDLTAAQVIAYIGEVRAGLPKDSKVEITTAEPWHRWLASPELGAAVDVIGAHIFPSHDGVPIDYAMTDFKERYAALTKAFPGKRITIAETGWPLAGMRNQAAVASPVNATTYVRAFLREAEERHYDYSLVEAYDQPWKAPEENGAMWGLLDNAGKAKFDFFNE